MQQPYNYKKIYYLVFIYFIYIYDKISCNFLSDNLLQKDLDVEATGLQSLLNKLEQLQWCPGRSKICNVTVDDTGMFL